MLRTVDYIFSFVFTLLCTFLKFLPQTHIIYRNKQKTMSLLVLRGYRNVGDSKAVKPLKTFSSGWMIFLWLNGLNPPFRQLSFLCTLAPPETTALYTIRQTRDCLGDAGQNSWNLWRGSADVLASLYERIVNKTDWGSLSTSHRCSDEDDGCYTLRLTLSDALVLEDSGSRLPSALAGSRTVSLSIFPGVLVCKCLSLCWLYFLAFSQRLNVGNPMPSTPPTLVEHRLLFPMLFWHLASTTVSWQHHLRDDFSSSHYGRFDKDYVFPLWDAWCVVQRTKHESKPTKILTCHYGSLCYIIGHRGWQCGQICQPMICFVLCKLLNKFVCIWYKFLSHTVLIWFVLLTIRCKYW